MQTYEIYGGGRFLRTAKKIEISYPYEKRVFAETFLADKDVLEEAILEARRAQRIMADLASYTRYDILMDIAQKLKLRREPIATVLAMEANKPLRYALAEVDRGIQTFVVAAEEAKRLPTEHFMLDWTPAGIAKQATVEYFPIGVVAGISPYNFPLNLAVHKIAPAIASGNAIVLKPSSITPLSVLELAKIIDSTKLPKGAVSVLPMDRETGYQLVTDKRIQMLSFTGSPEVGWKMQQDAGRKKVVLELGGNAGVIVTESASIDDAIKKGIIGGFSYSGQICIHAQRFFVQDSIWNEFTSRFVKEAKQLRSGSPLDMGTEISGLINEENAIRVEKWVNEAVENGAKVLLGGERNGNYYPPTILTDTDSQMKVCAEEVFGPVVVLERYRIFREAIFNVNDSRFGLQAGIFTNKLDEVQAAYKSLHVGGVIVNDVPTFRVDHAPYGGIKDSGMGREGVKYAMLDMMEPKLLVK